MAEHPLQNNNDSHIGHEPKAGPVKNHMPPDVDGSPMLCEILDVDGSFNVRDLGGYVSAGGKVVKYRRFIRSGSLFELTEQGKLDLLGWGVRCIIDIRSRREVEEKPSAVMGDPRFVRIHVPMLDYIHSRMAEEMSGPFPASLEEMYIGLLEQGKDGFRQLFELFASPDYESYLFHCTAGKDRTGVTAMLLLTLAGVDDQTIVQDYNHSEKLLRDLFVRQAPNIPQYLCFARPETMRIALHYLDSRYGGAQAYLSNIGITQDVRNAVLAKLFD